MKTQKSFLILSLIVLIIGYCSTAIAATPADINEAIVKGISWLVAQQQGDGSWYDPYTGEPVACTGFAVTKLADRAFELAMEPNSNIDPQLGPFDPSYPYKSEVEAGLDFIFQNADVVSISTEPAGEPDSDGDGNGVCIGGHSTYHTGICMMAIAASRAPNRVVGAIGSQVDGWTYKQVLDDIVDYMAWNQADPECGGHRGGWSYGGDGCGTDNSNGGYAVLGLAYAAESPGFICTIPQFVKDELSLYVDWIQCDSGDDDGGSGYSSPCSWVNILKTGNLIFEMMFAGRTLNDPNLQRALDYIGRTWNDSSQDPGWGNPAYGGTPHYQAMFCVMRGLMYAKIETIDVNGSPVNWYDEFAEAIVSNQQPDGRWPSDYWGGTILATEWALLTLERSVPPGPCPVFLEKVDDVNDDDCRGPGEYITYTIDYNYPAGPNCLDYNDVNIVDLLPAEVDFNDASDGGSYDSNSHTVTWYIGTLSPGESGSRTLKVEIKCAPPGGIITNECEMRSENIPIGWASENTPVCCPILTKVDDVNDGNCVGPGDEIVYYLCYSANGYSDTNVIITDELPNDVNFVSATGDYELVSGTVTWNIGTLGPNESNCVTLTIEVKCAEPNGTITNCCEMMGDCMTSPIIACENTSVCGPPTLTKVDDVNGCIGPGETITYTICYDAKGYGDTNVVITDELPNDVDFASATGDYELVSGTVTWNIGTLEPNESNCVSLTVQVKCAEPNSTITNCCQMTGDCMPSALVACEYTSVCCPTLTKVDDIDDGKYAQPNDVITYNIRYAANGYGDTNVVITDELPNDVNFIWASNGGAYNPDTNTVIWDIDILGPYDSDCLTLKVRVKPSVELCTTITNQCWMAGNCIDLTAEENTLVLTVGSYPNEVMADDPCLYIRFEEDDPCDWSGNNYWVEANPQVLIEKTVGSLGKAACIYRYGYVAAANQQTEPNLPVDYNHAYAFAPNDVSFELWFKAEPGLDDYAAFFNQAETKERSYQQLEPYKATAAGREGTKMRATTSPQSEESWGWRYTEPNIWPTDGDWHHLVVTYDEDLNDNGNPNEENDLRVKMYLDTELVIDDANSGDGVVGPEMDHILIGIFTEEYSVGYFKGYIDEFAIYPGVLSPCRITAHYAAWQPKNCQEVRDRQLIWDIDLNQDCKIDFIDIALFAQQWALCNDPARPPGDCPPIFVTTGIAWSTEVISIDLNGGDYAAYTGQAVYSDPCDVVWRAYYTGTGKPMGSKRSADLPDYNEPNIPSTYAAGVWISDPGVSNHTYQTGTGLMDDGFVDSGGAVDPCLFIFACPNAIPGSDPHNFDERAFGGTFDIYVYSANDTNFRAWTSPGGSYGPNECNTTGGFDGNFVEGKNYQVFENVVIDDGNALYLRYSGTYGKINGLQLVSKKQPFKIDTWTTYEIEAEDYDVAREGNSRDNNPRECVRLGPDIRLYNVGTEDEERGVGYLEGGESMTYDIEVVGEDGDGVYKIRAFLRSLHGDANVSFYLNMGGEDIHLGELYKVHNETDETFSWSSGELIVRLFEGKHTLRWEPYGGNIYFDIGKLDLTPRGSLPEDKDPNFDNCDEVYQYHYNYDYDFDHDCDVDEDDLAEITGDNWLYCYSPDPNECL
jgi:hypothetical protein